MASSRSWPFDDEDRPSGSVRPLSQADLQAILAHLTDDQPDQLLAGTGADRPVLAVRFKPSLDAVAWRRGAGGERRTARLLGQLERHGWAVLHDLAIPGSRPTSTTWPSAPAGCS